MKLYLKFILLFFALSGFSQKKPPTVIQRKIDSLQGLIRNDKEDTSKVNHLNLLSKNYQNVSRFDTSLLLGKTALALAQQLNFKKGMAASYNILGNLFASQGIFPEALKDQLKSLRIMEEMGDRKGIASSYNNLGIIYKELGNYSEALRYQLSALKIRKEIGDKEGLAPSYNNIGNLYFYQNKLDEALKNYAASLEIKKETGDKKGISASYNNLGSVYFKQKKYTEALESYLASLKIKEEINDLKGIATSYVNLASTYSVLKKTKEAKLYIAKAIILSKKIGDYTNLESCYQTLADLDESIENYGQALKHYKLFIAYRDSLLNEENSKKNIKAQMQYDFDKKSAADSIKNNEAKKFEEIKHQHEIAKQKTFTYGGIAGFIIMIIVAGISFMAFRNKKKATVEIERQKHIVEEKQKEILDSIYYARRIQRALITSEHYINKNLNKLKKS